MSLSSTAGRLALIGDVVCATRSAGIDCNAGVLGDNKDPGEDGWSSFDFALADELSLNAQMNYLVMAHQFCYFLWNILQI